MSKKPEVQMIPVEEIQVINPRVRNKKKFNEIITNISHIGLKRPITVSRRIENKNDDGYDLVCGQGRLEAFIALEQKMIPAIVIEVDREERLIMSLIENLARRTPQMIELYKQIGVLRDRGYTNSQIARKVDLDPAIITGIMRLLDQGEERLLMAVEHGHIPISVATDIAAVEGAEAQDALSDAYEKGLLKGAALIRARDIVRQRDYLGKTQRGKRKKPEKKIPTADSVVRAYNKEVKRQRLLVKKAKLCEAQLLFSINAFRQLLQDGKFTKLLKSEGLDNMPEYLADKVRGELV